MQAVTSIVMFEMPSESAEAFLADWREGHAFMREQPGLVGGAFYRGIDQGNRARFTNVAHWETVDAMSAARQSAEKPRQQSSNDRGALFERLDVDVMAQTFIEEFHY